MSDTPSNATRDNVREVFPAQMFYACAGHVSTFKLRRTGKELERCQLSARVIFISFLSVNVIHQLFSVKVG